MTNRTGKRPTHGYKTRVFLCGPTVCPTDSAQFEHDNYFGCIPRDFNPATGKSKTHTSSKGDDGLWHWNGGCNAAPATNEGSAVQALDGEGERDG